MRWREFGKSLQMKDKRVTREQSAEVGLGDNGYLRWRASLQFAGKAYAASSSKRCNFGTATTVIARLAHNVRKAELIR